MKKVEGDILSLVEDMPNAAFAHGCNCFCKMGKGLALQVKQKYPQVFRADAVTKKGDRAKLGTITAAQISPLNTWGINLYSQYTYWDVEDMFCEQAFISAMGATLRFCAQHQLKTLYLPFVGCGLANYNRRDFLREVLTLQNKHPNAGIVVVELAP